MADSSCTREDRRERIVAECNAVRQALQVRKNHYNASLLQDKQLLQQVQFDFSEP